MHKLNGLLVYNVQQIFPTSFCLYLRILSAADGKQQQLEAPIDILGKDR